MKILALVAIICIFGRATSLTIDQNDERCYTSNSQTVTFKNCILETQLPLHLAIEATANYEIKWQSTNSWDVYFNSETLEDYCIIGTRQAGIVKKGQTFRFEITCQSLPRQVHQNDYIFFIMFWRWAYEQRIAMNYVRFSLNPTSANQKPDMSILIG